MGYAALDCVGSQVETAREGEGEKKRGRGRSYVGGGVMGSGTPLVVEREKREEGKISRAESSSRTKDQPRRGGEEGGIYRQELNM